jgi:hypothetical protein
LKCQQCDFISQNEIVFNVHIVVKAHTGHPSCPFCLIGVLDYPALRKHCELKHKEVTTNKEQAGAEQRHGVKQRPCIYFKNGQGHCAPRSGVCSYCHTVIILSSPLIRERYAATKSSVDIGPTVSVFIQRVKIWKVGR